jgi:hypothetical protein
MKLVNVARFSNILGAIVWVLGLPLVVVYSVPFVSDATYFMFGGVIALLGLAVLPLVFAYPFRASGPLIRMVRGFGLLACLVLVVGGALLIGGSTGRLGDTAPSWIADAPLYGVIGFFVWILLVSSFTPRSTALGLWVASFGIFAGGSVLAPILISILVFWLNPAFISTDATIPFDLLGSLLAWWGLPIWLIALAVKMRSALDYPRQLADTAPAVDAGAQPPAATLS